MSRFSLATVRVWLAVSLIVGGVSLTPRARGSTIPVVTLDASGPDRDIPVGSPFYVTGSVGPQVSDVQVVVVSVGTMWLFGTTGTTCTKFLGGAPKDDGKGGGIKPLSQISASGDKAYAVWNGAGTEPYDADAPVYITPQWHRTNETGSTTYKVLVQSDGFFSSAGVYCLFVLTATHHVTTDVTTLKNTLLDSASTLSQCSDSDLPACLARRRKSIDDALKGLRGLTGEDRKKLQDTSNKRWTQLMNLVSKPQVIGALMADWGLTAAPGIDGGLTAALELPSFRPVATDPLARTVLGLLLANGAAYGQQVTTAGKTSVRYTTTDGATEIEALRILPEGDTIVVQPSKQLEKKTSSLMLDARDLSLRDLIEFQRGALRIDGAYVDVSVLGTRLKAIFDAVRQGRAVSESDRALIGELDRRTQALAKAVEAGLRAALDGNAADIGTSKGTLQELGKWLKERVSPCDSAREGAWGRSCMCVQNSARGAWPGYRESFDKSDEKCSENDDDSKAPPPFTQNPLEFLHGALSTYERALDKLPELTEALTAKIETITTEQATTAPVQMKTGFTQDRWVFSYVTPTVGVALINGAEFSLFYIGAQIHFIANPVDDPLWTRRKDVLRSFAIELGISTVSGSFGPDDRFSGLKGVPPVYLGGAIHPLPYTSLSAGGVLLARRSSSVSQEAPEPWLAFYLGLNVQANIPDLISSLKGRTSSSTNEH